MGLNGSLELFLKNTKKDFSFDAVAVRIVDPLGYMPFAVYNGLSADFIEDESFVVSNDCACGRVIQSATQPELPFYTERGSFWTNSLSKLSDKTKELKIKCNDRCRKEGFETLLVSPIKTNSKVTGSLFLASREENLLAKKEVDFLECEAVRIGEDILKEMSECDKYTSVIKLVAQNSSKGQKAFAQYMKHMKNCSRCNILYQERLKFDTHIRNSMCRISPPQNLEASILQRIYSDAKPQ